MPHQTFRYRQLDELQSDLKALGLSLPISENIEVLRSDLDIAGHTVTNHLTVHPMEACDSTLEGAPTELTLRRYERFARGGAGLIWMEAAAVIHEGRANPRQLFISRDNLPAFRDLVARIRQAAGQKVYIVVQLTHSGRYSRPASAPAPVLAWPNSALDNPSSLGRVITDEELEALQVRFIAAAQVAREAGFDAVDIKVCHRYLLNDLLCAYERPGKYGGSFENRAAYVLEILDKIRTQVGIDLAVRLNAYDEIPYPDGWGNSYQDAHIADFDEPERFARLLYDHGVRLIDVTGGNPYYNPHVNRPYNVGFYVPPTHPLVHLHKLLDAGRRIKLAAPDAHVIGTGFTWFQHLAPHVMAGCVNDGWFDMAGMGRMAFAYPDFARDILFNGRMAREKCCIACGKCTEMMRNGGVAGCPIRDTAFFMPHYQAGRANQTNRVSRRIAEHL